MSHSSSTRTAGAFDIRNAIGALLLAYGVILLATRALNGNEGGERSEAVNANLWAGLALLVVGGAFVAWAKLRPVRVPPDAGDTTSETAEVTGPEGTSGG